MRIPLLSVHKEYKKTLREARYYLEKGNNDIDGKAKKYYSIAYRIILGFEREHPMYIRKMERLRTTLQEKLK